MGDHVRACARARACVCVSMCMCECGRAFVYGFVCMRVSRDVLSCRLYRSADDPHLRTRSHGRRSFSHGDNRRNERVSKRCLYAISARTIEYHRQMFRV